MIQKIATINHNFYKGLSANTYFDGKFLKRGEDLVSGLFMTKLKSGKNLFAKYENGLLKTVRLNSGGKKIHKTYHYNQEGKLLKVIKNGDEVFNKNCGYVESDTISFYEVTNKGIELGYNSEGEKITAVIKPKYLRSLFTRVNNVVQEMRYRITNITSDAHNWYITQGKDPNNTGNQIETEFIKKFVRNKTNGNLEITSIPKKNITHIVEKDKDGRILSTVKTIFNKNEQPIWVKELDANGKLIFERKITYNDDANKMAELIYDSRQEIPFYKYTAFSPDELILQSKLFDKNKNLMSVHENIFDNSGRITESKISDAKGNILEKEVFKRDKNGVLISSHYVGADADGLLEGYYIYKNGIVIKEKERFSDFIEDSLYGVNKKLLEYKVSDTKGNLLKIFNHMYSAKGNLKKTIRKDANGDILYTINHKRITKKDKYIQERIFKDKNDKFIIKERVTYNQKDIQYSYFDEQNKLASPKNFLKYLND